MRRKGDMPLEMVFKFFLYIVVVIIVITMILNFRNEIVKFFKLCNWLPQACEVQAPCTTIRAVENNIEMNIVDKYCNLCWKKTGKLEISSSCVCYVVQGTFLPFNYSSDFCNLKCDKEAGSLVFTYDHLLKKVNIEC